METEKNRRNLTISTGNFVLTSQGVEDFPSEYIYWYNQDSKHIAANVRVPTCQNSN